MQIGSFSQIRGQGICITWEFPSLNCLQQLTVFQNLTQFFDCRPDQYNSQASGFETNKK